MHVSIPYMGSKRRSVYELQLAIESCAHKPTLFVEPFGGSIVWSLNSGLPWIAFDNNEELVSIFNWIQEHTDEEFQYWMNEHAKLIGRGAYDIYNDFPLCPRPIQQYLRYSAVSLRGAACRRITGMPNRNFIHSFDRIRAGQYICADYITSLQYDSVETFWAIDPPYNNTNGGYKSKVLDAEVLHAFISHLQGPVFFTYGDSAQSEFPNYDWKLLYKRNQTNGVAGSGTGVSAEKTIRNDYYCFLPAGDKHER